MAILGIDPGTIKTGYAIVDLKGEILDFGCIKPPKELKLSERFLIIHDGVQELVKKFNPAAISLELQFIHAKKNIQSIMKLCMARGIALIAAKKQGVAIYEYSPGEAKQAVTGNGQASKEQIQKMIRLRYNLPEGYIPEDATDALALAICHLHSSQNKILGKNEI